MSLENFPNFLLNFSECEMNGEEKHFYRFKSFRLNVEERQLLKDGVSVPLTPKAFDVLAALVMRGGHLVEKEELLRLVWADSFVEEANIPRIIHTLRKALGEDKNGNKYIETVAKKGYRFVAEARREEANSENHQSGIVQKQSADSENSEKRFWLWAISAAAVVSVLIFTAGFLFDVFEGKTVNALSFEQMRQTRLTQSGDVLAPTISPDGQYLVYVNLAGAERGLRLRQIATGQTLELLPPRPNVQFWFTGFSRNSSFVYYTVKKDGDSGILYRIPSLGGQPQKIVEFISGGITVSPDDTRLAFVRTDKQKNLSSIITADSDGANERTIASIDSDSLYQSLDWSPDGLTIAYAIKRREQGSNSWYVAEIPADGGSEHRISNPRSSKIINAFWLPDKKGFVMNALDAKNKQPQIYYLSYADGSERRITNDLNYFIGISMTADGTSIVTQRLEQDRAIWIASEGGEPRQITFKKDQHFEAVGWLSDDTLVFDVDENGTFANHNIWRLKIGEAEPQALTTGAGKNTFPVVAPDGKTIAFVSSRSGKPQIWRMNPDGSGAAQITDFDYNIYSLQFAPDRQTLYFKTSIGGKGRLMRVSIGGGATASLSDQDILRWAISPDGKKLAYSFFDSAAQKVFLRIRPIEEDRAEKNFDIAPGTFLEWSKDGKSLHFTLTADADKNLWRLPLTETKPQKITEFEKDKIFGCSASPDNKNLACIRFNEMFDAILLKFEK